MVEACEKSSNIVQCLLKCWLKAWNECGEPDATLSLVSIFAEGDGAIDVEDEAFGVAIKASSFKEYKDKWRAAIDDLESLTFELVGDPQVRITADRADISFELTAKAERSNGALIVPAPRWRVDHVWRQIEGEWRIVRERLKTD
ncbi:MAG: hypothetical protein RIE56_11590 [Amphiplicatus sp.]